MPAGRPTKYQGEETCRQASLFCKLGATDAQLAELFEVNIDTIHEWKKVYPQFSDILKAAKAIPDDEVEQSLLKRAKGYDLQTTKYANESGEMVVREGKHFPPDTVACIFWLKNRRPKEWRDKIVQEFSGEDGGPAILQIITRPPDGK